MNEPPASRLGTMLGLAVATAAAAWWLAATRLALEQAMDTAGIAASALSGLWLARATLLAPFALRAGALAGWRRGAAGSLGLVIAAWPVVLAAAAASSRPVTGIVLGEAVLLGACLALGATGGALRMLLRPASAAVVTGTVLGGAIAAATWIGGPAWKMLLQ